MPVDGPDLDDEPPAGEETDTEDDTGGSGDEWTKAVDAEKKNMSGGKGVIVEDDYETSRQKNIARNNELLKALELDTLGLNWNKKKPRAPRKPKEKGAEAKRRSGRQPKGSL
jgi:hypothetical protein